MPEPIVNSERSLGILHVLRSPLGGLFRHVLDLAGQQAALGHAVGIVADRSTGGTRADEALADLAPRLALGVTRLPMRRDPHPSDLLALARVAGVIRTARPDVVHGHGSKGGLYARLPGALPGMRRGPIRVYTPHGGSLHYLPGTPKHALYSGVERMLARVSDLLLFESAYAADRYRASVGDVGCLTRIAHNGLHAAEFEPVLSCADPADFVYVGELRALKGVDTFLEAFAAACEGTGRRLRAVMAGSGSDRAMLEDWAQRLGLGGQVVFTGPLPARHAFSLGRVLVVPSRAESLPYIVLEAAAAQRPIVATRVGGIPEIFGPFADRLVPSDDPAALRERMLQALGAPAGRQQADAVDLARHVRAQFSIERMTQGIMLGYREALAAKAMQRPARMRPSLSSQRYGL
jgi:glycosyltransferase involved in cell wall biosynthesis